jgi:hypothetical protein
MRTEHIEPSLRVIANNFCLRVFPAPREFSRFATQGLLFTTFSPYLTKRLPCNTPIISGAIQLPPIGRKLIKALLDGAFGAFSPLPGI